MAEAIKVVTNKVRFSYAHVFQPQVSPEEGKAPKYSVSILIDKSDKETIDRINKAVEQCKEENKSVWGGTVPKGLKGGLRDGDAEQDDPANANSYFINANSQQKPGVVDHHLNPIIDKSEFYSGCLGRASISFFAYNSNGSKGVGCGLNNVQKMEDGEKLGGATTAAEDFAV